jgi:hypothetical protein
VAAGDERHPGGRQRRIPGTGGSPADVFHYDQMLRRLTHLYDTSYAGLA